MDDQKIENLLNLAVHATEEERSRSTDLESGYNPEEKSWEVIVRYSGELPQNLPARWQAVTLSGGYAIVTLPQSDLDQLAALPQIVYIEKPKRLYFNVNAGRIASCIPALQTEREDLFGQGVLVAVLDSGVDYFHPDFRREDGSTRIAAMWDQTAAPIFESAIQPGHTPQGFLRGREYSREEINAALRTGSRSAGYALVPERDDSGHGTHVLGIAAGNGRASGGQYRGVASESDLIVVRLGASAEDGFPCTTELMQAVEYTIQKAEQMGKPVAINISIGNAYGSHEP